MEKLLTVPEEVTNRRSDFVFLWFFCHRVVHVAAHVRMANNDTSPVLLPEKFDGSQCFDDWVSHFECISKINGWNDGEKALWLKAHVTGKAHVVYNRFSQKIQDSFDLMRTALRERFEPSCKKELYKIE